VSGNLNKIQQEELNKFQTKRWYEDYELGNGKTLKVLVKRGLIEYIDKEIFRQGYTPWKWDKKFRKI
jgi:hypothetical protein